MSQPLKKILVAGGAGYIGSQTVLELLAQGYDPVVFDNFSRGYESLIKTSRWIQGDIKNQELVERVLREEKIDAVMHFAAFAAVGESVLDPQLYYENNVVGTLTLLSAMRVVGVGNFIFSSTCATYGVPEQSPITEDCPQRPINPYGFSKLVIESALGDYARAYGLRSVSLRYFNACGADLECRTGELHDPETHLIPLVIEAAQKKTAIHINGDDYDTPDGTCIRDYIHTKDLALAHISALQKLERFTESEKDASAYFYNLGTGKGLSVLEIISGVERIMNCKISQRIVGRRPGDPAILVADAKRAQEELNWKPKFSDLDTILKTALAWYQKSHRS